MSKSLVEVFKPELLPEAWGEAIETFLQGGGRAYSKNTKATYRRVLRGLASFLLSENCLSPQETTLVHLELWGHELEARGLSASSRALYASATKRFVEWLRAHELVDVKLEGWRLNAVLPSRRSPGDAPVLVPHEAVVASLFADANERDRAIVSLAAFVGLRPSAIGKIEGRDFVAKDGGMYLELRNGKRRAKQIVPLVDRVTEALEGYLRKTGRRFPFDGFLFFAEDPAGESRGTEGLSRWTIARPNKHAAGKAALSPRDLRHHLAVRYLEAGGALVDLRHVLGHASLETTTVYLRARQLEASRRTMERVVERIEGRGVETHPDQECLDSSD